MLSRGYPDYKGALDNLLSDNDMMYKPIFFLFEENPFWYATAHEVLKVKSQDEKFILIIFGGSLPQSMDGTKNFIKKNQGGFFRNSNWIKYSLRRVIPVILPGRKASRVLIESLKGSDVVVFDLSKMKSKPSHIKLLHRPEGKYTEIQRSRWEKITILALGEILSTDNVRHYFSKNFINRYIDSGIFMENILQRIIKSLQPVSVHYLNGRTFYERITLEVCKELEVSSIAYETNTLIDRYQSFEGSIGNLEFLTKSIDELWLDYGMNNGQQAAVTKGAQFFLDRMQDSRYNQFLLQMDSDSLITKNTNSTVYTFFTSSREEMYSLYSLYGVEPPDQEQLILDLINAFDTQSDENRKLIVRVHPNLRSKKSKDREFYNLLSDSRNVQIFSYDSGVNSYKLLLNSDFVLTTVSTIGLEAAYLNVPTFCFGKTFWSGLELTTNLSSVNSLFDSTPVNVTEAHQKSLKAGLYFLEYGDKYRLTNMQKLMDITGKYVFDPLRWLVIIMNIDHLRLTKASGFKHHRNL